MEIKSLAVRVFLLIPNLGQKVRCGLEAFLLRYTGSLKVVYYKAFKLKCIKFWHQEESHLTPGKFLEKSWKLLLFLNKGYEPCDQLQYIKIRDKVQDMFSFKTTNYLQQFLVSYIWSNHEQVVFNLISCEYRDSVIYLSFRRNKMRSRI